MERSGEEGSDQSVKPQVGVIGLGGMGSRMARRLLDAGYPLTVYNRTRERAQPLMEAGAALADSPADLATRSAFVLMMLTNDAAVRETLEGPNGVFSATPHGVTLLEMSTTSPELVREMAGLAHARGILLLDAPVSGSTPQAEQGALTIFVGGDREAFQRCEPLLQVLGKTVAYMGPTGSGKMMKLVVNTLLGLGVQALAEAIALGEKGGLERAQLLDVLSGASVVSPSQRTKIEDARTDEYPPTFPLTLMAKDYGLLLAEAERLNVPMPATAAAAQVALMQRARDGAEDFAVLIRLMRQLAGLG